jgi:hypothetical protein
MDGPVLTEQRFLSQQPARHFLASVRRSNVCSHKPAAGCATVDPQLRGARAAPRRIAPPRAAWNRPERSAWVYGWVYVTSGSGSRCLVRRRPARSTSSAIRRPIASCASPIGALVQPECSCASRPGIGAHSGASDAIRHSPPPCQDLSPDGYPHHPRCKSPGDLGLAGSRLQLGECTGGWALPTGWQRRSCRSSKQVSQGRRLRRPAPLEVPELRRSGWACEVCYDVSGAIVAGHVVRSLEDRPSTIVPPWHDCTER